MKKMFRYLKPYWLIALLSPITMIAEVAIDLKLPELMSHIVDDGILKGDQSLVWSVGIRMILYSLLGVLCGVLSCALGSTAAQRFGNDLRCDVYRRVMSLSPEQTDKFTTGSLVTRITNDISQVQNFMNSILRHFVRAPMFFVGGIFMMLRLDLSFAKVVTISLPLMLLAVVFVIVRANPYFTLVQEKLDKVNSVVMENVTGARVVKAYVREDHETRRFGKANDELCDTNLRVSYLLAILSPVIMIIMNLSVIAILYIGGLQVQARQIEVGSVMAAVTYVTQILMSVMMITMIFQSISRANASAKRVAEVLDTHPVITGGERELTGEITSIEFRGVSFRYPGTTGENVLSDINLTLHKGEKAALLGSTGSGKTTFVSLIARYYDVTSGAILINGIDVKEYTLSSLRAKLGYVLQKSELFSGTIADNIRWGDENAPIEDVYESARIAQADEFIRDFTDGYDTVIGEKGASLSGGQKQRVSIARSILKKPEVLIFDDSTSALDLGTEARLQAALKEKLSGTTVLMIAQRIASIKNCDRIFVLDGGRVVGSGTHDELLAGNDVYRDIYASQFRKEADDHE